MKKVLVIVLLLVLFLVAMDVWGQSGWLYDRQWSGTTDYEGSGRAKFDDIADLHNNWSGGRLQKIEHPSNEQMDVIKYGLRRYTVRNNDVYTVLFINDFSNRHYIALVIITSITTGGGYNFSYFLWEDLSYRRN